MNHPRHGFFLQFSLPVNMIVSIWLLAVFCMPIVGCSISSTLKNTSKTITKTTRKIAREISFAGDGLKKSVAIVRFENKTSQANPDFEEAFHHDLIEILNTKCRDIIVVDPNSAANPGRLVQLPKLASGQTDNFALAIIGRQLGINAVITGSLNDIRPKDEEGGILWTKETHFLVEVLIRAEVYDTQTATKILDESFKHKTEIDELEYKLIEKNKSESIPRLDEAFAQILSNMADRICEVLDEQQWSGYVTAVNGEKISISAGSRVGLKPGHILEAFDSGRVLEGIDGQKFFAPGLKTAEIKIISVSDISADAVKVSGRGLKEGSIVRKK